MNKEYRVTLTGKIGNSTEFPIGCYVDGREKEEMEKILQEYKSVDKQIGLIDTLILELKEKHCERNQVILDGSALLELAELEEKQKQLYSKWERLSIYFLRKFDLLTYLHIDDLQFIEED